MKLSLLRAPKALIVSSLALLGGAFATADTAEAQRNFRLPEGPRASVSATSPAHGASASVSLGQEGVRFDASLQRARVPRGYDGGRYETRYEKVWVPGRCERVWHPARYEWRYDSCGRRVRVCVEAGHWDTIQHPGYFEQRAVQVWVPARRIQVGSRRGYDRSRTHRVSQVGSRRFR